MLEIDKDGMVPPGAFFLGGKLHVVAEFSAKMVIPTGEAHKFAVFEGQVHVIIQHIRRKGLAQGCHGFNGCNFKINATVVPGDFLKEFPADLFPTESGDAEENHSRTQTGNQTSLGRDKLSGQQLIGHTVPLEQPPVQLAVGDAVQREYIQKNTGMVFARFPLFLEEGGVILADFGEGLPEGRCVFLVLQEVALGRILLPKCDKAVVRFPGHTYIQIVIPGNEAPVTNRSQKRTGIEGVFYVMLPAEAVKYFQCFQHGQLKLTENFIVHYFLSFSSCLIWVVEISGVRGR